MAQWFIFHSDKVDGPLSTDEVKQWADANPEAEEPMVWGRPQSEWRPIQWWLVELPELATQVRTLSNNRVWHYAIAGQAHGPFSRENLIENINGINPSDDLLLWTKGMKSWAPIFEFHDILNEVGINRRQHPRADIDGSVEIVHNDSTQTAKIITISEGGCGILNAQGLKVGDHFSIEIQSDGLVATISAKAEVRYMTDAGYLGVRFNSLSHENRGAIIQFIRNNGQTLMRAA